MVYSSTGITSFTQSQSPDYRQFDDSLWFANRALGGAAQLDSPVFKLHVLKEAANMRYKNAEVVYAKILIHFYPEKTNEAISLLEKATTGNHAHEARILLADYYRKAEHVEQHIDIAIDYLKQCGADQQAYQRLVLIYLGNNCRYNQELGLKYLNTLVVAKDGWALAMLGLYYFQGAHGLPKNLEKASEFSMKATGNYHTSRLANDTLFAIYHEKKDFKAMLKIFDYTSKTANQCYQAATLKFYNGDYLGSVTQTLKRVINHKNASTQTLGKTYRDLGRLSLRDNRKWYSISCKKAVKYWKKGCELDNADCHYYLGLAYYSGKGVNQDKKEAKAHFEAARDRGHPEAQAELEKLENNKLSCEKASLNEPRTLEECHSPDNLELKEIEKEDRLVADKRCTSRLFHWIKRNSGPLANTALIVSAVALVPLAAVAIVGAAIGLTIAFPYAALPIWLAAGAIGIVPLVMAVGFANFGH